MKNKLLSPEHKDSLCRLLIYDIYLSKYKRTDSASLGISAHRLPRASIFTIFKQRRSTAQRWNATGIGRTFPENTNVCPESEAPGCDVGWKDASVQLANAAAVLQ